MTGTVVMRTAQALLDDLEFRGLGGGRAFEFAWFAAEHMVARGAQSMRLEKLPDDAWARYLARVEPS